MESIKEKPRGRHRTEPTWGAHLNLRERHRLALEEIASRDDVSVSHAARKALDAGLTALADEEESR